MTERNTGPATADAAGGNREGWGWPGALHQCSPAVCVACLKAIMKLNEAEVLRSSLEKKGYAIDRFEEATFFSLKGEVKKQEKAEGCPEACSQMLSLLAGNIPATACPLSISAESAGLGQVLYICMPPSSCAGLQQHGMCEAGQENEQAGAKPAGKAVPTDPCRGLCQVSVGKVAAGSSGHRQSVLPSTGGLVSSRRDNTGEEEPFCT